MRFPNIIVSAVVVGVVALLQHLLGHVSEFGIPELYAPVITVVLTTVIKMVQEIQTPQAAARGVGDQPASYLARVLYK